MAEVHAANLVAKPLTSSAARIHPSTSSGPESTDHSKAPRPLSPRKRRRFSKPTPTRETRAAPSPTHSKLFLSPSSSPKAFTGAIAIAGEQSRHAEETRREQEPISPNPKRRPLEQLVAGTHPQMSKPSDAPSASPPKSKPLAEVTSSLNIPSTAPDSHDPLQTSPHSTSSNATFEPMRGALGANNGETMASPANMDDAFGEDEESPQQNSRDHLRNGGSREEEGRSNKAFTFPGSLATPPHRTSSLPQAGYGRENSTSSVKRHKCPYCNTDFTRHHNLKSHLLTHSQEKPFSCDRCESRFRRLHDLKRHAKLHTGERPHVCPKCERSFARGDALARHNKGQGGCAGRRESLDFAGDERHDDSLRTSDGDSMAGILYTNEASHEPEHMDEDPEAPAEQGLPRIQKHEAPPKPQHQLGDHQNLFHARQSSTYPPVAARSPASGQLYPPPPMASPRMGSSTSTAQSSINHYPPPPVGSSSYQSSATNVFTQGGGMTESPKPLSPGAANTHQMGNHDPGLPRNRSPSLTHHLPQTHFRRPTGSNTSPTSWPPPHPGGSLSNAPHLPPLHGLPPPDTRYTLQTQSTGPSQLHPSSSSLPGPPPGSNTPNYQPGATSSAHNSSSSHSTGQHGSLDRGNPFGPPYERLWAIVESLTSKVHRLEEELATLKAQNGTGPTGR